MKTLFLNKSIAFINSYQKQSKEDIEKIKYGLEGIYLTFYKVIILLLVSLLLKTFKETIIVMILFNIIRYPAFGFHANTSMECLILSLSLIIGLPLLLLKIDVGMYAKIVIGIICLILFVLYAPADTVKRPLPNVKKRKIRKAFSVIICLLFMILSFIFINSYVSDLLIAAVIIESILISPITYKLFKQPYRNYLNCS